MPELLIDFITSLDGYGAAEGWPGFWGLEGPEYLGWLNDQPEEAYTVLMGATTYRLMHGCAERCCSPDWSTGSASSSSRSSREALVTTASTTGIRTSRSRW